MLRCCPTWLSNEEVILNTYFYKKTKLFPLSLGENMYGSNTTQLKTLDMKSKERHTIRFLPKMEGLMCMVLAWLLTSCSSLIDEDLSDCLYGTGIRFEYLIYDDNGGAANAFPTSVDLVSLYIFDDKGKHIATQTESGKTLQNPQWRMPLELAPGNYQLIAWAGLDGVSFNGPQTCLVKEDTEVSLKHNNMTSQNALHPLWHGAANIEVKKDYTEHTVSLIKDTRRIRIVLQQINGNPVNDKDFDFAITDDNSRLGYNNLPIANGELTYLPYTTGQQGVGGKPDGSESTTVAFAEFNTSRLVANNPTRLKIHRTTDDETVIDIPLLDYLLLRRAEGSKLSDQQFFDRNDAYTLVFFLDKNMDWIKTQIIINDWVIRLNEGELGAD